MTIPQNKQGIGNGFAVKLLCLLKMYPGKPTQIPKGSCSGKPLVQAKVTVSIKAHMDGGGSSAAGRGAERIRRAVFILLRKERQTDP